jgi:multidrug resistance efflux pump
MPQSFQKPRERKPDESGPSSARNSQFVRSARGAQDAHALQQTLDALIASDPAFCARPIETKPRPQDERAFAPAAAADTPAEKPGPSHNYRRVVKICVGVALVAALGWRPVSNLMTPASIEAAINARIVTIRAPIDGVIEQTPATIGGEGQMIEIANARAERTRLDALSVELGRLEDEGKALELRRAALLGARDRIDARAAIYRRHRTMQIAMRAQQAENSMAAAAARVDQTRAAARRADTLIRTGATTAALHERAQAEHAIAMQTVKVEQAKVEAAKTELQAAESGVFTADGMDDAPNVLRRLEDISLQLEQNAVDLELARWRTQHLTAERTQESLQYLARSRAREPIPSAARVWEQIASVGEHVVRGQEIMKILDCSQPSVTASVDESTYDRLAIGDQAMFRPDAGGRILHGTVSGLLGPTNAVGNLAIAPLSLRKSPLHVTVALEDAGPEDCIVGRTGVVSFGARRAQ